MCGKKVIDHLLAEGRHGKAESIRYIYLKDNGEEHCRILISVPKKLFKRAVKRNLLKRRIRESWRQLKHGICQEHGIDILFIYSTKEVLPYGEIYSQIEDIINRINQSQPKSAQS